MTGARPLSIAPGDGRPDSALAGTLTSTLALGGLVAVIVLPLAFVLLVALSKLVSLLLGIVLAALPFEAPAHTEERALEEDVIEARFVQLGRDFQNELPNREVPAIATARPPERAQAPTEAPSEPVPAPVQAPTERSEAAPPPPPAAEQPPAVAELLARLDQRAGVFGELAELREREGSPEGIAEGTETQGTEGDLYRGRLRSFFRRGWSVPTTLPDDELRRLTASVAIEVGQELQIVSFELRRSSGDALFDESVMQQLARLQGADQRLPPPPEEEAANVIGRTLVIHFRGADAR